jgi:hypothetical protein
MEKLIDLGADLFSFCLRKQILNSDCIAMLSCERHYATEQSTTSPQAKAYH